MAEIKDLFAREVVRHSFDALMTTGLVMRAFAQAAAVRRPSVVSK